MRLIGEQGDNKGNCFWGKDKLTCFLDEKLANKNRIKFQHNAEHVST